MYTKFIKNFNEIFGKKINLFFAYAFILIGLFLTICSLYSFSNLRVRNKEYFVKYVTINDEKGSYLVNGEETEVKKFFASNGEDLDISSYDGETIKMYCSKTINTNCVKLNDSVDIHYVLRGLIFAFVIISIGVVFRKLYKIRNCNYGTIEPFKFMFVTLFVLGLYLFVSEFYYVVDYMRFSANSEVVKATVYSKVDDYAFVKYSVNDRNYSGVSGTKYSDDLLNKEIDIKYDKNKISSIDKKFECNLLVLIIGVITSVISFIFIFFSKHINAKIKENERILRKQKYKKKA